LPQSLYVEVSGCFPVHEFIAIENAEFRAAIADVYGEVHLCQYYKSQKLLQTWLFSNGAGENAENIFGSL